MSAIGSKEKVEKIRETVPWEPRKMKVKSGTYNKQGILL